MSYVGADSGATTSPPEWAGGEPPLEVLSRHPGEGTVVIEVHGALDAAGATRFAESMRNGLSTASKLVIDLSKLSFVSTDGIVVLLEAEHRALVRSIPLVLVTGNRLVDRLLALLEVTDRFCYADNLGSALAHLPAQTEPGPVCPSPRSEGEASGATGNDPTSERHRRT